jgi:hypothetical protein
MKAKLAFLNRKELHDNFDWATFWATFSQKSSGHPGNFSSEKMSADEMGYFIKSFFFGTRAIFAPFFS